MRAATLSGRCDKPVGTGYVDSRGCNTGSLRHWLPAMMVRRPVRRRSATRTAVHAIVLMDGCRAVHDQEAADCRPRTSSSILSGGDGGQEPARQILAENGAIAGGSPVDRGTDGMRLSQPSDGAGLPMATVCALANTRDDAPARRDLRRV
jgi:hypothetical protein